MWGKIGQKVSGRSGHLFAAVGLIEPETPGGTHRSFWDIDNSQEIEVRPALLNKQESTRFCLAEVTKKQYSSAIHLGTVGEPSAAYRNRACDLIVPS